MQIVKKIRFLGMLLNVIDGTDIDRMEQSGAPTLYVCIRVADSNPAAGSRALRARRVRTPCEDCGHICWYDPKGLYALAALKPTIVCVQCMTIRTKKDQDAKRHNEGKY